MRHFRLLVALLLLSTVGMAQTRQLSGTITDSKTGSGIPSVTVKVKGQSAQTVSNSDGVFSLNVPTGKITLEFTSVGYGFKTVSLDAGSNNVSVALDQSSTDLSEVTVTALGISKESKKIGYSVTKVDGGLMNQARETNVALSLTGRVAGLNVTGTNGGPGGSARILLRGMSSFNAGSPLFVINGIPMDNTQRGSAGEWGGSDQGDGIGNLNPDDIESMTVLKGASASALYGARAANGVVLVTTKTGKKNQNLSVEYNGNYSVDKAIDFTDFQYVYGQGVNGQRPQTVAAAIATGMSGWGEKLDGAPTIQFDGKSHPYSAAKNNIKNFYRAGPTFTNTVSVSGGNERSAFRLSLSDMANQSIMRNSGISRKTINLNVSQKVTDKLDVSVVANYLSEDGKNRPNLSDGPLNANNVTFLAGNVDQEYLKPGFDAAMNGAEMQYNDDIYVTNPWFVVNQGLNNNGRKRLIGSITAKYSFTNWLFLQARTGMDQLNDNSFGITPWGTAYSNRGGIGKSSSQSQEINSDVLIGARRNIIEDLSVDLSVGANLLKRSYEGLSIGGGPFILPYFYSPYNVENYNRGYGYSKKEAHSAYYTADFTYKNILTLSTAGRYDTYSTLPASNRSIFTPSVSASLLFDQLVNIPSLSYGKLRVSYGVTSGEPSDAYQTSQYYNINGNLNGIPTGSFGSGLPNLFLKPFTLSEIEVGTELRFFNNRAGIDVAYFSRQTNNEIVNGPLSVSTGYSGQLIGTGKTKNSGLELLLTGSPIRNKAFSWNVSFNFTTVKNKIVNIDGNPNATLGRGTYRPLNANLALVTGLAGPQIMANDYLRDASGNVIIDANGIPKATDRIAMGSTLPKAFGGLNNEFSVKNFNLSFLIDYKFGGKVLTATNYYSVLRGLNKSTLEGRESGVVAEGVQEDGSKNDINVPAQQYYQAVARRISANNVMDASFIKLRQVTLGYTVPAKVYKGLPVGGISVSLVARNLAVLMKKTDNIDPEAGFSSNIGYAGIEGTSLPSTRTYGVNVNIKFK